MLVCSAFDNFINKLLRSESISRTRASRSSESEISFFASLKEVSECIHFRRICSAFFVVCFRLWKICVKSVKECVSFFCCNFSRKLAQFCFLFTVELLLFVIKAAFFSNYFFIHFAHFSNKLSASCFLIHKAISLKLRICNQIEFTISCFCFENCLALLFFLLLSFKSLRLQFLDQSV